MLWMRLLITFDLPVETGKERRRYRMLVKKLESEGFYRYQYSLYVRVCTSPADVENCKIRLRSLLSNYDGDVRAISMTDKQFVRIESLIKNSSESDNINASIKRLLII